MKGILLLAAIHVLIMYQAKKGDRKSTVKTVAPAKTAVQKSVVLQGNGVNKKANTLSSGTFFASFKH